LRSRVAISRVSLRHNDQSTRLDYLRDEVNIPVIVSRPPRQTHSALPEVIRGFFLDLKYGVITLRWSVGWPVCQRSSLTLTSLVTKFLLLAGFLSRSLLSPTAASLNYPTFDSVDFLYLLHDASPTRSLRLLGCALLIPFRRHGWGRSGYR